MIVENNEGLRIDKFLSLNTNYTRSYIAKLIANKDILVNNKEVTASYKVCLNDNILINDTLTPNEVLSENIKLDIVYEDEYLLVLNKASGLVVHPGNGNKEHTLVNALMYYTKNLSTIGGDNRLGIVHRLDKDTSGLMLVAKNNEVHSKLSAMFANKEIKREYTALLEGVFPHDSAYIDAPIGRDVNNRKKMIVTDKNSKEARSHLKVIKRYKNKTLVNFILETGRTHQIRVHALYIGYPVFNDPVYFHEEIKGFGQFLHSSKITFIHPITKKSLEFSSPLPKIFADYLKLLN